MLDALSDQQQRLCRQYGAPYLASPAQLKVGIAENARGGLLPIHGLRHPPKDDTTGWFIWAGEFSDDADFFKPVHVEHLREWCPAVLPYLGLGPGWRFLIGANGYVDVWEDRSLLGVDR